MSRVALITGGNGITGSAILEHLVNNTTAKEWSRIIVTSRSPFQTTVCDDRISFIPLDFSEPSNIVAQKMRSECSSVTHAYFSSYIHKDEFTELNRANEALFENFLDALIAVAPNLENCTLQTGGKYYNVHLGPVPSPAREDLPRIESPIGNFYFQQEDHLFKRQKDQKWTWNVNRPEAIIGYTSKPNGMNSALTFALYFMVCKELGAEASMPTNQTYFNGYDAVSDSRLIADLTIYASTHEKFSSTQVFAKESPVEGILQLEFRLAEWVKDKREVWDRICDKAGMPTAKATWDAGTWAFQDRVFQRTWYATLSISKARKFGWTGYVDSYDSFRHAFEKLKELKQILNVEL
ncbi:hypothetical protein BP5796_12341 [Coleophoma crateriformis]|uniref:PRISE-like Rossmann-fold domain-containing protein n=1 Tax=Coleophoma crateriformis TaxID=565419 RepID=A0A3D8Q9F8_9HELO|nr:hypothetical protein BP5796_12341 [Coleophoma crateriformis]